MSKPTPDGPSRYFDKHTLYVHTEVLDASQVDQVFSVLFTQLVDLYNEALQSNNQDVHNSGSYEHYMPQYLLNLDQAAISGKEYFSTPNNAYFILYGPRVKSINEIEEEYL